MSKDHNMFSDMAKLANSALATTANMKNEMTKFIKGQIESFIKSMNFVEKKEFDVLKKMVVKNTLAVEKLTGNKDETVKSSTKKAPAAKKSVKSKTN